MPAEPSYAFNTFNTMGASNGSGVEMTDSFEDFRKKTNGIINQIEDFAVAPVAYGLVTWEIINNTPSFSIENSFNVEEIGFNDSTGIRIAFEKSTKDSNFLPYGNLGSRDTTILPITAGGTSEKNDRRNQTDFGTVVFHTPTTESINMFLYRAGSKNLAITSGGFRSASFIIFGLEESL